MIEKRLNDIDDFFGIDGFSEGNLYLKLISPLDKNVDKITITFQGLKKMYEFEKAFIDNLDYLNHKFGSEDICPPIRKYKRTANEKELNYTIKKLK